VPSNARYKVIHLEVSTRNRPAFVAGADVWHMNSSVCFGAPLSEWLNAFSDVLEDLRDFIIIFVPNNINAQFTHHLLIEAMVSI
jgi:hypothetical protein